MCVGSCYLVTTPSQAGGAGAYMSAHVTWLPPLPRLEGQALLWRAVQSSEAKRRPLPPGDHR
jgi:hypothetical protein